MLESVHSLYFLFGCNVISFNQDSQKYETSLQKMMYLTLYELVVAICYVSHIIRLDIDTDKFYMIFYIYLNSYIWLTLSIILGILIVYEDRQIVKILNEIRLKGQSLMNFDIESLALTSRIDKSSNVMFFVSALYFGPILLGFLLFVVNIPINLNFLYQLGYHMVSVQFILRNIYFSSILAYFSAFIKVLNKRVSGGICNTNQNILKHFNDVEYFGLMVWKFQVVIQCTIFFCLLFITYLVANFFFGLNLTLNTDLFHCYVFLADVTLLFYFVTPKAIQDVHVQVSTLICYR